MAKLGAVLLPLAIAAVLLLAATTAATTPGDKPTKSKGPEEYKPEPPTIKPPKPDKPEVPKKPEEPKDPHPKPEEPKDPKEKKQEEPKDPKPEEPKEKKPEDPKDKKPEEPKDPKPEEPKDPKEGKPEGPKPKPKPMKVKCRGGKKLNPYCCSKMMECPEACSQSCYSDCNACKPICVCSVPGACGDPRFIGGDGNAFYFHGHKDADFCVVSDRDLHINAHFIGKRGADMARDFTWIQAITVLFDGHRLYVGAKKTAKWDNDVDRLEITLDGEPVHLAEDQPDATWTSSRVPALSVTRTKSANGVFVALDGRFNIRVNVVPITEEESRVHRYGVTADDCLAHLELTFKFDALTDDVHGVVGQTYRSDYVNRFDVKASMPTMGGKDNFSASSLFAADCAVSRFGVSHGNVGAAMMSELAGVSCASGMDGKGVVCKK